jgi:recombination protein RecT
MPAHCKPERMARVALTAITRTPGLADCDQASFFKALLELSQWGLEPDGRRAHLIPFRNNKRGVTEVQLIIDWKGLAELVYRSGVVTKLHADVVHEGDLFEFNMGEVTRHVPWFVRRDADKPAEQGKVFAAYAQASLTGGLCKAEVLSREEVEAVRKRSRAGNSGPWVTDWSEMAKKTAFRRLSKWLPLSADLRDAMERDDDRFEPIVQVRQAPQAISDISALIADGERFTRTAEESQEELDEAVQNQDYAAAKAAKRKMEHSDAIVADGEPDEAALTPVSQSQDSDGAASYTPIDRAKALGEFAEASSVTEVNQVLAAWRDFATEDDLAWLDKMAKSRRSELRK